MTSSKNDNENLSIHHFLFQQKSGIRIHVAVFMLCLIACIIPSTAFGENNSISPEMDGFRGYPWGMALREAIKELKPGGTNDAKKIRWFQKKEEDLRIGSVQVDDIHYVFQNSIFVAASVMSKTQERLFIYLQEQLGAPDSKNQKSAMWSLTQTITLYSRDPANGREILIFRWRQ